MNSDDFRTLGLAMQVMAITGAITIGAHALRPILAWVLVLAWAGFGFGAEIISQRIERANEREVERVRRKHVDRKRR